MKLVSVQNITFSINENKLLLNNEPKGQFASRGLYVKEDDQDWGSGGMNNIQKESE